MAEVWMGMRRAVSATATVLLLLWTQTAAAAEAPPYPVWWSPVLGLESLDDIDARLARDIWPEDIGGLPLASTESGERKHVTVNSCVELNIWLSAGYEGIGTNGWSVQQSTESVCRAIEMLRRARPAKTTYLRDFMLDEASIRALPALINLSASCDFACRQWAANDLQVSLPRFEPVIRVTVESPERLRVRTIDWESILSPLGRGDFSGDGLDDLLVMVNSGSISGTWRGSTIYLLTRTAPDAVLTVLEEGRNRCGNYQCESNYDYPRALRDIDPEVAGEASGLPQNRPITFDVIGGDEFAEGFIDARSGPPFAVWWDPLMGVERLADIDELLARDHWLRSEDTILEIESAGRMVEVPAPSCRALLKMLERGYRLTDQSRSHASVMRDCEALQLLATAEPAKTSHLRDFVLDHEADTLGPILSDIGSGDTYDIRATDERTLLVSWPDRQAEFRFAAGGDLSRDGFDDVLVAWITSDDMDHGLLVLTRREAGGELSVVQSIEWSDPTGHSNKLAN